MLGLNGSSCHDAIARPQAVDRGESLQMQRANVTTPNKQLPKRGSWGEGLPTPHCKFLPSFEILWEPRHF